MGENMYKVIVMDVDGTLVNNDKKLTAKTKEALLKVQSKGVRLIIASGRPTTGVYHLAKELKLNENHGYIISYNGSCVIDCETKEVLFNQPLTVEEEKMILHHTKKFNVTSMVVKDDYLCIDNAYGYMVKTEAREDRLLVHEVKDMEEFVDFTTNKVLVSAEPETLDKIIYELGEPFKDLLHCVRSAPWFFEYTQKGLDKANALSMILPQLNCTKDEIIAFGDGHNDISLLKYVGYGIAMSNAVEDLKKVAKDVTLSNDNDGIAFALTQIYDISYERNSVKIFK